MYKPAGVVVIIFGVISIRVIAGRCRVRIVGITLGKSSTVSIIGKLAIRIKEGGLLRGTAVNSGELAISPKIIPIIIMYGTTVCIVINRDIIELYKSILNSAVIYVSLGYAIITYVFRSICQSITAYNAAIIIILDNKGFVKSLVVFLNKATKGVVNVGFVVINLNKTLAYSFLFLIEYIIHNVLPTILSKFFKWFNFFTNKKNYIFKITNLR